MGVREREKKRVWCKGEVEREREIWKCVCVWLSIIVCKSERVSMCVRHMCVCIKETE